MGPTDNPLGRKRSEDTWLRRLVGQFQWEGVLDVEPRNGEEDGTDLFAVRGCSDCVAIGSGPGVHCVLE